MRVQSLAFQFRRLVWFLVGPELFVVDDTTFVWIDRLQKTVIFGKAEARSVYARGKEGKATAEAAGLVFAALLKSVVAEGEA